MTKVRVLQVVYSMNRGGVETWLMHVLRNIDRSRFQIDFLVHNDSPGHFDEEIHTLGSEVIFCAYLSQPWRYIRKLKSILQEKGPYDAVHSHDMSWNGLVMSIAQKAGVPIRITHSHNAGSNLSQQSIFKRLYCKWSINRSQKYATHGLACSSSAARAYFGKEWPSQPKRKVLLCGQDFSAFQSEPAINEVRNSLGIPTGAYVVGHVGSFRNKQKNHAFIIKIAKSAIGADSQVYFLLVGEGKLKKSVEALVVQEGLEKKVLFAGVRSDVPKLMIAAMDVFLFPSLYEGLGLALVEAQAAGLPCVFSDTIPLEASVVPELMNRMSLTQPPNEWSKVILQLKYSKGSISREKALTVIKKSPFNIFNGIKALEDLYSGNQVRNTKLTD